jgi:bifunctional aspartokinase / homoserine dehydrogenase 1
VLRGYGAGTEVTAAGVFADLLRTLNWKQEV